MLDTNFAVMEKRQVSEEELSQYPRYLNFRDDEYDRRKKLIQLFDYYGVSDNDRGKWSKVFDGLLDEKLEELFPEGESF